MEVLKPGSRIAVGSMPWPDPEVSTQAQFRAFPEIPAWAQIPKRSPKERVDRQGLSGFPGLTWSRTGEPILDLEEGKFSKAVSSLKEENRDGKLGRAALTEEEAAGFGRFLKEAGKPFFKRALAVKGQVLGPVSLGICLKLPDGKPLLSWGKGRDLLVEYVQLQCRWQARELGRLGLPVVIFLDEPFLGGLFEPSRYGLEWNRVRSWFTLILGTLQEEGVLTGIHCCGKGPWDRLLETEAEIFHFDAFHHLSDLTASPGTVGGFLRKGGFLAWGLVPTAMSKGTFPGPSDLFNRWEDAAAALAQGGLDPGLITERTLLSTACGLGESSMSVAAEAGQCLASLASLWRTHSTGG